MTAPTSFALSCTIFAMLMRIVTVFAYYFNKKGIYVVTAAMEVFMNIMLFMTILAYEQP